MELSLNSATTTRPIPSRDVVKTGFQGTFLAVDVVVYLLVFNPQIDCLDLLPCSVGVLSCSCHTPTEEAAH